MNLDVFEEQGAGSSPGTKENGALSRALDAYV
jgi:hypothetical protein